MLDLPGILSSPVMMFLVILRTTRLGAVQPWFRTPKTGVDQSGLTPRPDWRRSIVATRPARSTVAMTCFSQS
jgi:hypothetical protein